MNPPLSLLLLACLLSLVGCASRRSTRDVQNAPTVRNDLPKSIDGSDTLSNESDPQRTTGERNEISEQDAIEIAKRYYGLQPGGITKAEFEVKKLADGYRVFATFGTLNDTGELISYPGGHGFLTISSSGEIVDVFGGA